MDPFTIAAIISAVVAAAGTGVSVMAQNNAAAAQRDAQEGAARAQMLIQQQAAQRVDERQDQASAIVDNQIQNYQKDRQEAARASLREARGDALSEAVDNMPVLYSPGEGHSEGLKQSNAAETDTALKKTGNYASTLADLRSYDDLDLVNAILGQDTNQRLATLGDFSAGDARTTQSQLRANQTRANSAPLQGSGWSLAANVLSGLSSAANVAGAYYGRSGSTGSGTSGKTAIVDNGQGNYSSGGLRSLYGW